MTPHGFRWSRQHFKLNDDQKEIVRWMRERLEDFKKREAMLLELRDDFLREKLRGTLVRMARVVVC